MKNLYESDRLLAEYLLFHYGTAAEVFNESFGASLRSSLHFQERCVTECLNLSAIPAGAGALDVGCAVGRSSFELSRYCERVTGIDSSRKFIDAAEELRKYGRFAFRKQEEGAMTSLCVAKVPEVLVKERVSFETGDAMQLRGALGGFDVVLAANLLCRLTDPAKFLSRLPELVKHGGQLVITTPCTWLDEFTPRANWLCDENSSTLDGLHRYLDRSFSLQKTLDLPFVIREHARKFQWTVAQASRWIRQ